MNRTIFSYHSSHDFKSVDVYLSSFPIKRQTGEDGFSQIWLYTGPPSFVNNDPMFLVYLSEIIQKTILMCKSTNQLG